MKNPKRDFSLKSYSPLEIEQKWQKKWQDLEAFNANVDKDGQPFCIVIPPPKCYWIITYGTRF